MLLNLFYRICRTITLFQQYICVQCCRVLHQGVKNQEFDVPINILGSLADYKQKSVTRALFTPAWMIAACTLAPLRSVRVNGFPAPPVQGRLGMYMPPLEALAARFFMLASDFFRLITF